MAKRELTPEAETLQLIVDRRGRAAVVSELRGMSAQAEASAAGMLDVFRDGVQTLDVALLAITAYAEQDATARRRLSLIGEPLPDEEPVGAKHLPTLIAHSSNQFVVSLARAADEAKAELDAVEEKIGATADFLQLEDLVVERRRLKQVLEGLDQADPETLAGVLRDRQARAAEAQRVANARAIAAQHRRHKTEAAAARQSAWAATIR